ncbi:unnamed protein product [Fusarium graminearum]|uniref:Chromosome 1, complete genome n=1 Tax=Gibberella zeae (strain ATCC MYA-4620 / CBS 123657 / FGSC 9075 / NRRL 31084 / PH-1) TaxID=229533 RepID=A0A098D6K2_GIBZE|nr:unnamed protein product [Fusarium graminearum]CZS76845.1 unnamed protein product [Fusarium graminearum]
MGTAQTSQNLLTGWEHAVPVDATVIGQPAQGTSAEDDMFLLLSAPEHLAFWDTYNVSVGQAP